MTNEFGIIPPKCNKNNWNALLDHGLEKTVSYIIRIGGTGYECLDGSTGKILIENVSASVVIQTAVDALTTGGLIFFKQGTYLLDTGITVSADNITFAGEGAASEIRAHSPFTYMFDIRTSRYTNFSNIFINGYNLADYCISGLQTPSGVPVHQVRDSLVWGAKEACIDFTGCEDSLLFNVWIDGRIANDTPTCYTKYGLKLGPTGDAEGYKTGGIIKCFEVRIGFCKYADAFIRNVAQIEFFGALFSSKYTFSTDILAHIIVEGGAGVGSLWTSIGLHGCWFDGALDHHPNILISNRRIKKITIDSCELYGSQGPNIYSALNPAVDQITVTSSHIEKDNDGHDNIDCYVASLLLLNTDLYRGGAAGSVNMAKATRYFMIEKDSNKIETNMNLFINAGGKISFDDGGLQIYQNQNTQADAIILNAYGEGNITLLPSVASGAVRFFNTVDSKYLAYFNIEWMEMAKHAGNPVGAGWNDNAGRIWYDTTDNKFKYWNGSAVKILAVET